MASLPNPIQVSGKHNAIFEAYYKQIDPKGTGAIEAMTAAKFLKKSGLSDVVLSRIWDLSDPNGRGFLDKPGFFVSLKLVSLAQAGLTINMSNIFAETANPPKVGDLPKIVPQRIQPVPAANTDWSMKVIDRLKYEQLFESLNPVNGFLAGNKVKGVLMDSKLPMETLGKIWDLADQDKDGNLDKHEFIVAMHLVYQALEKRAVPNVLPPELQMRKPGAPPPIPAQPVKPPPPAVAAMPRAPSGEGFGDGGFVANFPTDIAPPPVPPLPVAVPPMQRVPPPIIPMQPLISTDPLIPIGAPAPIAAASDWVVVPSELKRFEIIFRDSDKDRDGLVSGLEVKNVFLQSGVPQNCLAHIWALCDTNQSGKLTLEQFALAMWMVERKQKGIEPPQVLTANMVPPSMRGIVQGVDITPQEPKPTYSNPELEMISKEIEELAKERRALETEIAQKEADIRIKSGEVRSLQSELDTLTATLKQLENQRGEAQKRLDDLKAQVNKVREQCSKQEETINEQEGELNSKRSELQKLKDEEASLEKDYEENRKELDNLSRNLQDTQLQISQVRSMVTQLLESQREMTDALIMCKAAIEANQTELVTEYQLKIEGDLTEAKQVLEKKITHEPKADDPFQEKTNGFGKTDGFSANGFAADPFTSSTNGTRATGGFDDSSFNAGGFDDSFSSSGFGAAKQRDPFGAAGAADPFGDKKSTAVTPEPGKDDFGSDPFAALHAPTGQGQVLSPNAQRSGPPPRPESPSPALPPKKSKQPPPRPAPPRPVTGPPRPSQPAGDAFGPPSGGGGGFADFADFDNKQPSIPPPQPPITVNISSTTSTSLFQQPPPPLPPQQQPPPPPLSTTPNQFSAIPVAAAPAVINLKGPADFVDDPFKDYRYEDPFSIKDPFADEEFIEQNSSEDETKKKIGTAKTISASPLSNIFSNDPIAKSAASKTNSFEFLDNFDAFNANPSPVPSLSLSGANKSSARNTPFDNFANFDAFSTVPPTQPSSSQSTSQETTTTTNTTATTDFFDAFDDNFKDVGNNNNAPTTVTTTSAFDAFGDNTTSKAFSTNNTLTDNAFGGSSSTMNKVTKTSDIKVFDDVFNDNAFEDDFFKMNLNDNNNVVVAPAIITNDFSKSTSATTSTSTSSSIAANNGNFAKFDLFAELSDSSSNEFATALNNSKNLNVSQSKIQKKINLGKTNNINEAGSGNGGGAKVAEKFAGDYSNPDSFDADLEEALKRSMAEK
ncbi:epidermal growth factor receptor substrate 15-like 1 isoform X2 [Episyrphus balteatus]|uniref:epidermal growth factor receptor substrate 15-like 1 isoform X2 n=1 Tax=Episyrphus balteatus TaxID=286459 RepID=UPI0024862498|nr:epidermal growth factor receptor substrate 15-like 1 isoform X2 [Episyrphus balteatus]